jgi:hypothetical protein
MARASAKPSGAIICHNICVFIQESHELGIEVEFRKE